MPLWKNLIPSLYGRVAPSTPEGATTRAVGGNFASIGSIGGQDVDNAVSRHYERVIWVFKCVDSIATKLSELDIAFREGTGPTAKETTDIALDRILNRQANGYETGQAFRYRVVSLALLSTRGVFVEKVYSAAGTLSQLHVLPPGRVEPIPDPDNYVAGYWITNGVDGRDFLPPERVLWIKLKPHPTDPYRQMTPLMSAGLAADTDWLARIYNRNFLSNDGRPGMLVTVQDLQPQDADKLESRFSGGASKAGQVSIIEGNGVDVVDMSTSPRDVMWLEALDGSRDDILAAYGVPMIAFGSSNEKTFDNADAESVSYWTETLNPTGNILGRAYDSLTPGGMDDDIHVIHDTSKIYALQQVVRERQSDLAGEVAAGLRSINSYLEEIGRDRLPYPECDLLWFPGMGTIPIGDPGAIKTVMERLQQAAAAVTPPAPAQDAQQAPRQVGSAPARRIVGIQQLPKDNGSGPSLRQLSNTVNSQGNSLRELSKAFNTGPRVVKRARQHKSASVDDKESDREFLELKDNSIALESMAVGLIEAWSDRCVTVSTERLVGPKARKHTRHWQYTGESKAAPTRVLDARYVVNKARWIEELRNALVPMLTDTVKNEMQQMVDTYGLTDDIDVTQVLTALTQTVVNQAITQTDALEQIVAEAERHEDSLATIRAKLESGGKRRDWVQPFAASVINSAVQGARHAVAQRVGGMHKTWRTSGDERVRDSHRRLNGKTVRVDKAFNVGGVRIRRPHDPLAPISETINCRCYLQYSL